MKQSVEIAKNSISKVINNLSIRIFIGMNGNNQGIYFSNVGVVYRGIITVFNKG